MSQPNPIFTCNQVNVDRVDPLDFVRQCQAIAGLTELQGWVESGICWQLEGAVGRAADRGLECGQLFLGTTGQRTYWGNSVPSRGDVVPGSKGSLELSVKYWTERDGDLDLE